MNISHDIIDAFLDGEPVDRSALKTALADEAARDYLIDTLALRDLVRDHISLDPASAIPPAPSTSRAPRVWAYAAAAAIVLASGWSGFAFGHARGLANAISAPAALAPASDAAPTSGDTAAPAPTRVIRLQPGVNWRAENGGH